MAGVVALCGVTISALPHVVRLTRTGECYWFADYDDYAVYSLMGGQAYHNHPYHLTDPVCDRSCDTYFSDLQSVPGVLLARSCGTSPLCVNMMWRVFGGAFLGVMWYFFFLVYLRRPILAAFVAVWILCDAGVTSGQLLYLHAKTSVGVLHHPDVLFEGLFHPIVHWRILNPSLSLPWLVLYLWSVAAAVNNNGKWATLLAGGAFGSLFYVYFYLWTAAGLGLVLTLLLDAPRRRMYVTILLTGILIGAPALYNLHHFRVTHTDEWLARSDKFLPVGRFDNLLLPRVTIPILLACLAWVWMKRRDLLYLACLALAGFLLMNHQVVTKLEIENWHWNYAFGPSLAAVSMLGVLQLLGRLGAATARGLLVVLVAAVTLTGFWLRCVETAHNKESLDIDREVRNYLAQRPPGRTPALAPNAVVAGDAYFVETASILENTRPLDGYSVVLSANVNNEEWDSRAALNAYLAGMSRDQFQEQQTSWLNTTPWGPWAKHRDPAAREERLRRRLACWDRVRADPAAELDRFRVRYVALPVLDHPVPPGRNWDLLQDGPHWRVWQREPAPSSAEAVH